MTEDKMVGITDSVDMNFNKLREIEKGTGKPRVVQSMGSQRVGHDLMMEQQHVQFQSPMLLLSFGHNYACLQGEVVRESIGVSLDSFLRKMISLLVVPHSMWEASSMTKTQTHIPCIGSTEA